MFGFEGHEGMGGVNVLGGRLGAHQAACAEKQGGAQDR
jgi:hypothetical protein